VVRSRSTGQKVDSLRGACTIVEMNSLEANKGAGIEVPEEGHTDIRKNEITQQEDSGVVVKGRATLQGNRISRCWQHGVEVGEKAFVCLRANKVTANDKSGFFIQAGAKGDVEANITSGNAN